MNKLECIISDLDGTLIGDNQKISDQDLCTIKKLKTKGVRFFVATGRPAIMCRHQVTQLGNDYPVVSTNGANIFDFEKNESIHSVLLPEHLARRFVDYCKQTNRVYYVLTLDDVYIMDTVWDESYPDRLMPTVMQSCPELTWHTIDENFQPDGLKIVKCIIPWLPPEELEVVQRELNYDDAIEISYSGLNFADFNAKGIHKGSSLSWLSKRYGFSVDNTIAMGDNTNDISMLDIAGWPVAPENASEEVKAHAKFITSRHTESPLTHAVEALFPEYLD